MTASDIRTPLRIDLSRPQAVEGLRVVKRLHEAGFTAFFAGGCVRDALSGAEPKDYDVATDATPDAVRQVFGHKRTLAFGASFGVIGVQPDTEFVREPTEVATFRSDGNYSDGRRPDSVTFGNAADDALRRDFTINGLFFDPIQEELIDYVGGRADLDAEILRTIGAPEDRFDEDKLRMLRAVRFATVKGFTIDPATFAAIRAEARAIDVVSNERIGAELRKVLTAPRAAEGIDLMTESGLAPTVWPQLADSDVPKIRRYFAASQGRDVPTALALIGLAHRQPTKVISALADAWKLSNEECRAANAAIELWSVVAEAADLAWSRVQPVVTDRDAATIIGVARTVTTADDASIAGVVRCESALDWPAEELDPPALVSGNTLKAAGIRPGPHYRPVLQQIRDAQLDGQVTSPTEAEELARELFSGDSELNR